MGCSTRVPFAFLVPLAVATSAYSTESSASAVESAKRDLRALPAAEIQVEGAGKSSLLSGSSALPGLSLGSPAPGASSPKKTDDAQKMPSGGWLLDGMRGLESEARLRETDRKTRAAEPGAHLPGNPNPLGDYLTQWLSPRDQGLRLDGANSDGPATTERSAIERAREKDSLSSTASPFQTELPGLAEFAGNKRGTNPYLTDPLQTVPERSPFVAAVRDRGLTNASPAISLAPQSTPLPAAPAPIQEVKPALSASPTSQIVDDRKYFPQLRRF